MSCASFSDVLRYLMKVFLSYATGSGVMESPKESVGSRAENVSLDYDEVVVESESCSQTSGSKTEILQHSDKIFCWWKIVGRSGNLEERRATRAESQKGRTRILARHFAFSTHKFKEFSNCCCSEFSKWVQLWSQSCRKHYGRIAGCQKSSAQWRCHFFSDVRIQF